MANMHQLLKAMVEKGASDLHITTGTPPQLRIDGKLHPLRMPPFTAPETKQLCYSVLTDDEKVRACELSKRARANFVKTSTGFASGGATAEDIALMASVVHAAGMEVKASGGVRTYKDACKIHKRY